MSIKWEKESAMALKAATESGEILKKKKHGNMGLGHKDSFRDLVTEYDLLIEKNILSTLTPSGFKIVSEENYTPGTGISEESTWVVDPIDGTVNFAYGIPMSTISIGLMDKKDFAVGVVCAPNLKELYFTHGDQAAYLNGKKLSYTNDSSIETSLFTASFSGTSDSEKRAKEYQLFGEINDQTRGVLRLGSAALTICYAASGRIDCAYGINAKIWDVAGALAVAKLAGCEIEITNANEERVDYIVGNKNHIAYINEQKQKFSL